MKRWQRNIVRCVVILIAMILLLPMVIYVPPLQRMACRYAEEWVSENTPIQLSVGSFSLQYPLRVGLHDVVAVMQNDTVLVTEELSLDVALFPLLRKVVIVRSIYLDDVALDFVAPDSTLQLQAHVGNVTLKGGNVKLNEQEVSLDRISLDEARIAVQYIAHPDTIVEETTPIDWDVKVGEMRLSNVDYSMYMPPVMDTLQVTIPLARLVSGDISLLRQEVAIERVKIENGEYRYVSRNRQVAEYGSNSRSDTIVSQPWEVQVANVDLSDNQVAYITSDSLPGMGLDFSHIVVENMDVSLSNIFNRGSALQLTLDKLSMQERSGLSIKDVHGELDVNDSGYVALRDFTLATTSSQVHIDAGVDMSLINQNPDALVSLTSDAFISCSDIACIYPDASQLYIGHPDSIRPRNGSDGFSARIAIEGMANDIKLKELSIGQEDVFTLDGSGVVAMPFDMNRRVVELSCRLGVTDNITLANYIPDTSLLQRIVMHPIELDVNAQLAGSDLNGVAHLSTQEGTVDMTVAYDARQERYEAQGRVQNLPIDKFLPNDSIGLLSARLNLSGQYFSIENPALMLDAQLVVDTLQYKNYLYSGVDVMAHVADQHWAASLRSGQPSSHVDVSMHGEYQKDFLSMRLNGNIGKLDLSAMHFMRQPFDVSGQIVAEVVLSNIDSIVQADVEINDLLLGIGEHRYYAQPITLIAASDITYSYLDLRTGDMDVNLSSDVGLTQLRPGMERLTQFVDTIFQKQRLNMDELHHGLPPFEFTAGLSGNNILQQYLNSIGIRVGNVKCNVSNDTLFNISSYVHRMEVSGLLMDTITFDAHEKDARLNYSLAMINRPGNMDEFAHVRVEGFLSGNSTRLYCLQRNRKDDVGFLFGCKVDFKSDTVRLTFGPQEPIIGYKRWMLNSDNYLTYVHSQRDILADVRLSYENSHIYVSTEERRNKDVDGVHIDMQDIKIADWVVVSPLVTPMSGLLSANVYIDMPEEGVEAAGTLDVIDYVYNNRRVGTFHADVDYSIEPRGGNNIRAALLRDGNNVLDVVAYLDQQPTPGINGSITISEFPLEAANAFFPHDMGKFSGELNSRLSLTGHLSSPTINGFIRFDDATTSFDKIGATLTLDNTEIPVKNSRLSFLQYGIRGANNVPLNIDGVIDFSRLTNVGINLDFKARNFQPIHIAENRTGIIYGTVYTDVDARVRGTLANLNVSGNVSLLSGTNATYVMQSNRSLSSTDYSEMVSFVTFSDTTSMLDTESDTQRRANLVANVDIDIDQGVQLGVNLSLDGSNRIDLVGGGNLLYTSTAMGDNRMTGRYTLTGGFVRYTPPFISQKIFNIEDGSYVSWNGNIADPTFNIKAVQSQRSTVKSGEDSRLVDFDVSIMISNTLKDLDISFDLATTDDLVIENELQGLTAEQREVKAMNMFLYNSYDNLASAAENSLINNPLNTFLEYELNTWAQRTLRGVDLTFGIDNYGIDGTGTQRTDYSYQFSKSLLDNRLKVVVGGSYASNQDVTQNLKENLIDDISLEYRLTKRDNMYIKVFRQTGYESIIEGEITQTGAGFLYRKQVGSLLDLFRKRPMTKEENRPSQPTDGVINAIPTEEQDVKEEQE